MGDAHLHALHWVSTRGVEVIHWSPSVASTRTENVEHPVLYLVAATAPAPVAWGPLEDWVRLPSDTGEVYDRADRLLARAADAGISWTYVDADDVLRAGALLVPLSPLEASLVRALLERAGTLATREELELAIWPCGPPSDARALDNRLKRLRRRLEGLPLRIHTVRGRGFLLDRLDPHEVAAVAAC